LWVRNIPVEVKDEKSFTSFTSFTYTDILGTHKVTSSQMGKNEQPLVTLVNLSHVHNYNWMGNTNPRSFHCLSVLKSLFVEPVISFSLPFKGW